MPTHRLEIEGYPPCEGPHGASLLEICDQQGIPMESACGGFAGCNSCRVDVLEGDENLGETFREEIPFLDHEGQRLGCQARLLGPAMVRLSPGM